MRCGDVSVDEVMAAPGLPVGQTAAAVSSFRRSLLRRLFQNSGFVLITMRHAQNQAVLSTLSAALADGHVQWRVVTDGDVKRDTCSDVDAALELRRRRHPGLDVET